MVKVCEREWGAISEECVDFVRRHNWTANDASEAAKDGVVVQEKDSTEKL